MKIVKNPDNMKYEEVTVAVKNNDGYCPCSLIKSNDTKCICKEFLESSELGLCHCGRYLKKG